MKLTGKAEELFENWCYKQSPRIITWSARGSSYETLGLYDQPESMQWGVYQDWADSIGYLIEILVVPIENTLYRFEFDFTIYNQNEQIEIGELGCKTRQEARNASIEKLNEIINNR